MPPKRKTSAKKKQNARIAVAPSTANADTQEKKVSQEEASIRKLIQLAGEDRLDAKRLAKYCPDMAQGLRDGSVNPEDVILTLIGEDPERAIIYSGTTADDAPLSDEKLLNNMISALAGYTLPDEVDQDILWNFAGDLRKSMLTKHGEAFSPLSSSHRRKKALAKTTQLAFVETWPVWERQVYPELNRYLQKPFRTARGLYEAPLRSYIKIVETVMSVNFDSCKGMDKFFRADHASQQASKGILEGLDRINQTCWECEKAAKDDGAEHQLMVCSRCNTAAYCSVACQKRAWCGGHKQKCSVLKPRMERLEQMLRQVDNALKINNGILHGLQLSLYMDHHVVAKQFENPVPIVTPKDCGIENPITLKGPSMKFYYENLERIAKGEWWIFGNPVKYNKRQPSQDHSALELVLFLSVAKFLMYDVVTYAKKLNFDLSTAFDPFTTNPWMRCEALGVEMQLVLGRKMSASTFLSAYHCLAKKRSDCRADQKNHKAQVMQGFRKALHK